MKQFLTIALTCLPLLCFGAPTYTTYFNNTHTYTNATVAVAARVGSLVSTNGVTSQDLTADRASFTDSNKKLVSTGTSAALSGALSDETGSGGVAVFASNPSLAGLTSSAEIVSTLGSISADASALDATATWNNAGVTFTGLKLNITDTASAAGSLIFDFQASGTSILQLSKGTGGLLRAPNGIELGTIGSYGALLGASIRLASGSELSWSSVATSPTSANKDTILVRDAANTLALRNGTAAQTFNIYNTYTDTSNYERSFIKYASSVFEIGTEAAGTGTARQLKLSSGSSGNSMIFRTAGTDRWVLNASGHILALTDNTYDIGASGATRPRNIYVAGSIIAGVDIAASGDLKPGNQSRIKNSSDGVIRLTDAAGTDFSRLQFGGTSASFPALKRSTTELQVRLADDSADGGLKSGSLSNTGIRVMTPSSLQTLAAANALLANATKVRVVGSGGAVTLTSTPTIADGSDGQYVMIQGTDDTNTLTVQDQGSLASSNLELGAATRVLGAGDVLVLTFDSTASVWYEVSFANN